MPNYGGAVHAPALFRPTGLRCRRCGRIGLPGIDFYACDIHLCKTCHDKAAARLKVRKRRVIVDFDDYEAVKRYNAEHPIIIGEETAAKYAALTERNDTVPRGSLPLR